MAMYVTKRCPHCGSVYEGGHARLGIGKPFLNCPECNGVIVDTDDTEWELKRPLGKAAYVLIGGWTSLVWGASFPMVAVVLVNDLPGAYYLLLWGGAVACSLAWLIYSNLKDIRESQERMKDPQYRELLKTLGLLKG